MSTSDRAPAAVTFTIRFPARLARATIAAYRILLSPLLPPACRFAPSCSKYADEAIERYGFVRGSQMAVRRVLRCHPFHPGGYDPVR